MRITVMLAIAAILAPATLPISPAAATGVKAAQATDLSAAKKKKAQKPKAKKEEYLKAAPSAPPSSGKSTY
jgi:hypothetical protein